MDVMYGNRHLHTPTKKKSQSLSEVKLSLLECLFSFSLLIFSFPAEFKASLAAIAEAPQGVSKVNLIHYKQQSAEHRVCFWTSVCAVTMHSFLSVFADFYFFFTGGN